MTTQTTIDLEALRRAIEERDAAGMLALYADDAEVRLADRDDTPGNPRVLSGKEEIRAFVQDVCARDMTHRVEHAVADGDRASFLEACSYPDGTNVLCAAALDLRDGLIVRQVGVQAWDA
jgi:ketosteroid isomerase-like protein